MNASSSSTVAPPLLSILVPTIPGRETKLHSLLSSLEAQAARQTAAGHSVEVLVLRDNKQRTIAAKRNALLRIARGMYVAFVDDDDLVAPHYVQTIVRALTGTKSLALDLFCFRVRVTGMTELGIVDGIAVYDPDLETNRDDSVDGGAVYMRQPNHLMVWRRSITLDFDENLIVREDNEWATRMRDRASVTMVTDDVLYTYVGGRAEPSGRVDGTSFVCVCDHFPIITNGCPRHDRRTEPRHTYVGGGAAPTGRTNYTNGAGGGGGCIHIGPTKAIQSGGQSG